VTTTPQVLFVGWQSPENRAIYPIARLLLRTQGPRYEFTYVHGVLDAMKHGFIPFRELPQLKQLYFFHHLPPLFTNRLMPHSRPDFAEHLEQLGLGSSRDRVPEPEVILARSGALKATDKLEVSAPPEFDVATRTWTYHGFARGVRHVPGAEDAMLGVHAGDLLEIESDVANDWDARALLMLRTDRARLGFVPHILIEDLGWLMDHGVEVRAEVVKINLAPAPTQQRLLVAFKAEHRPGFAPMSTQRFQPMGDGAARLDLASVADLHPAG